MKVLLLVCMIGFTLAAPRPQQKPVSELTPEELEELKPEPYQFGLEVNDDEFTNYQNRVETQDENGVVQGQYSFVGPNGIRYTTKYTADPVNGYQAVTTEEQTGIQIIIPVHKPQEKGQLV